MPNSCFFTWSGFPWSGHVGMSIWYTHMLTLMSSYRVIKEMHFERKKPTITFKSLEYCGRGPKKVLNKWSGSIFKSIIHKFFHTIGDISCDKITTKFCVYIESSHVYYKLHSYHGGQTILPLLIGFVQNFLIFPNSHLFPSPPHTNAVMKRTQGYDQLKFTCKPSFSS